MANCLDCGEQIKLKSKFKKHTLCSKCKLERKREYGKVSSQRSRDKYYLWLQENGCSFCKTNSPSCLEVHHLCKHSKRYNTKARGQSHIYNKQDVEDGLAIILCANCHSTFHRHFGGKNAKFPDQTRKSTLDIIKLEYTKWEAWGG